jgi:hypothetical protein
MRSNAENGTLIPTIEIEASARTWKTLPLRGGRSWLRIRKNCTFGANH